MGKSKVRVIKKASKSPSTVLASARPTFEIEIEDERRSSAVNNDYRDEDDDDQSIKNSASKTSKGRVKKVKNVMSESFPKTDRQQQRPPVGDVRVHVQDMDNSIILNGNDSRSSIKSAKSSKKKKPNMTRQQSSSSIKSPKSSKKTNLTRQSSSSSMRSARNSAKKKKKGSVSTTPTPYNESSNTIGPDSDDDDNMSVRSDATKKGKKSSKKKKKKKSDSKGECSTDDDDISVDTTRSSRSTRSKQRSTKKSSSKKRNMNNSIDGMILDVENNSKTDQRRMDILEEENAALLDETATIRRQLNETEKSLKLALSKQQQKPKSSSSSFEQTRELEIAQIESYELRMEIEEYEDAVIEKDSLIQKLTEAVDAQLDKVEYLEEKLERAENEFCKIEEEMEEMEDVIEVLQEEGGSSPSAADGTIYDEEIIDDDSSKQQRDVKLTEIEVELEERERKIDDRELFLLEMDEQIRERETLLQQEKEEFRLVKESQIVKEQECSLYSREEESDQEEETDKKINIDELKARILKTEHENSKIRKENDRLRQREAEMTAKEQSFLQERDEELRKIQDGVKKEMTEMSISNEVLQKELDELKQQRNSDDKTSKQKIRSLKQQKNRLEASTRHLSRRNIEIAADSLHSTGSIHDVLELELEVEIAELREKIVEKEEHSRRQKQDISNAFTEKEEFKQELQEREIELRDLETQLTTNKETSMKKMTQKDETITFMQTEMMKIMQEKQLLDKQVRGEKLDLAEKQWMGHGVDEEEERARIEAVNVQLRNLDDENRELEDKLKELQYNNSLRLKENQGIILDLQEELSDAKWELGAREKGADYITLLKDRKERKRQLDKARKEAKISQERVSELERINSGLEREIDSLKKSVTSIDSSDHESGIKRQIKSLKQHNAVLEQKLEAETRELMHKDTKLKILEFKLERFENPAQTAIRGVFSLTRSLMKSNDESDHMGEENNEDDFGMVDDTDTTEIKQVDLNQNSPLKNSVKGNGKGKEESTKTAGTGNIWSLFSPGKKTKKVEKKEKNIASSLTNWESKLPSVEGIENEKTEKESTTQLSDELDNNEPPLEVGDATSGSEKENEVESKLPSIDDGIEDKKNEKESTTELSDEEFDDNEPPLEVDDATSSGSENGNEGD